MDNTIKSGKQILDDFFANIEILPNTDIEISKVLRNLYEQSKLTDTNIKNELQKIRDKYVIN